ncbi:MAG: ATP-binding protein [Thermodesulfobacteriota bacterium]
MQPAAPARPTAKLLVVDDDLFIRETISEFMTLHGYAVTAVENGGEAIAAAAEQRYQCALIDIVLPDMTGTAVLEALRHHDPGMICCMMTGNVTLEDSLRALKGGAVDFFMKPLIFHQVEKRFSEALTRQRLEKELASSREQQRLLTETALDGIIVMDEQGRVDYFNPAAERIFGFRRQDILGRDLHEMVVPERLRQQCRAGLTRFWEHGTGPVLGRLLELTALHQDGHEFPVELSLAAMTRDDKWVAVGIVRDISERKKAEAELLRSREELARQHRELQDTQSMVIQQEKLASIGHLAAGVAHEINNPMGFIYNNLQVLAKYSAGLADYIGEVRRLVERTEPEVRQQEEALRRSRRVDAILGDLDSLIAECLDGARRVNKIVGDLKSFSRQDEDSQYVDLNGCVETALNVVWNELKHRATVEKDFGDLPPVRCVAGQISQVVMNLLVNATDALRGQGQITVRTWREPGWACIAVADNGPGIPASIRRRIFEPFFTTKAPGSGTGLGLSISLDIVRKHGGTIEAKSERGAGSVFTVRLPLDREPEGGDADGGR